VTTSNTNPEVPPNTGVTRSYNLTLSRGTLSPDGVNRSMLLINGAFPGPLIEANWGDTINITVFNSINDATIDGEFADAEGTSLHWHGLLQQGT
jgi:FtsP/CotA-like multicopper oxidase with cupredoxin domain